MSFQLSVFVCCQPPLTVGNQAVEFFQSQVKRVAEALFFMVKDTVDAFGLLFKLGVSILHLCPDDVGQLRKKRLWCPEHAGMSDGASDDLAEGVAPTKRGWI